MTTKKWLNKAIYFFMASTEGFEYIFFQILLNPFKTLCILGYFRTFQLYKQVKIFQILLNSFKSLCKIYHTFYHADRKNKKIRKIVQIIVDNIRFIVYTIDVKRRKEI